MTTLRSLRPAAGVALMLLAAACDSFEPELRQVAVITVPTQVTDEGYTTTPTVSFFEGTGIRLSSTLVSVEGCVDREIQGSFPGTQVPIDAGPEITVLLSGTQATLTPRVTNGRMMYQLPEGASIPFNPGALINLSIPGADNGFPERVVSARTAEAFTVGTVTLPASSAGDLALTWTPVPTFQGSAMFFSFRYFSTSATGFDREIACVFIDDGTGVVNAGVLSGFRGSEFREILAQRAVITANQVGSAITHVTSTFGVTVPMTSGD